MGSQKIQGELWGRRSKDWASIQSYTKNNGHVIYNNKFREVISENQALEIYQLEYGKIGV